MFDSVAVVGATGAVGAIIRELLDTRKFPYGTLKFLASARSAGKRIEFAGHSYLVEELRPEAFDGVELAIASTPDDIARDFIPPAVARGCIVIDESGYWRMDPTVPLVIPEVNPQDLDKHQGIIASPNCSTTQMVLALKPLHDAARVRRVVVSTYQAASGAGAAAMAELEQQTREVLEGKPLTQNVFPLQYAFNVFSHNSAIGDDGYNEEEVKMVKETRKIFDDQNIRVAATCVRVPVMRAHGESINIEFEKPMPEQQAVEILRQAPGVAIIDDREHNRFPTPLDAADRDDIFVGRIRRDISRADNRGLELFVCADQIRKGAALNAVQIAELVV